MGVERGRGEMWRERVGERKGRGVGACERAGNGEGKCGEREGCEGGGRREEVTGR